MERSASFLIEVILLQVKKKFSLECSSGSVSKKALASKPGDLSLNHVVGEKTDFCKLSFDFHMSV